jgi:SRSO17 transposase
VTPEEIAQVRPRLLEFASSMLADGRRKSMQPMAERLGVDHQGLQQFITSSTWDYKAVRAAVARWGAQAIGPDAFVVDDTGFPKDGKSSPLVARIGVWELLGGGLTVRRRSDTGRWSRWRLDGCRRGC